MDWITWVEPIGKGPEAVYCFMKVSEVISHQNRYAKDKYDYEYKSDQDALDEFMVIHWATFCDAPIQ